MKKQRLAQAALQPCHHLLRLGNHQAGQQHDKFLAAKARQVVDRTQTLAHRSGQGFQRGVASGMTQAVVEFLEIVDVDQAHRQHRGGVTLTARALHFEGLVQATPIGHLRKGIGGDFGR